MANTGKAYRTAIRINEYTDDVVTGTQDVAIGSYPPYVPKTPGELKVLPEADYRALCQQTLQYVRQLTGVPGLALTGESVYETADCAVVQDVKYTFSYSGLVCQLVKDDSETPAAQLSSPTSPAEGAKYTGESFRTGIRATRTLNGNPDNDWEETVKIGHYLGGTFREMEPDQLSNLSVSQFEEYVTDTKNYLRQHYQCTIDVVQNWPSHEVNKELCPVYKKTVIIEAIVVNEKIWCLPVGEGFTFPQNVHVTVSVRMMNGTSSNLEILIEQGSHGSLGTNLPADSESVTAVKLSINNPVDGVFEGVRVEDEQYIYTV